jgi:hypothetical protein
MRFYLFLLFFVISCDRKEILLDSTGHKTRTIVKDKYGYVIKELSSGTPNGIYRYYDKNNNLYKLEWYTKSNIPYYTYNFTENFNINNSEINNFKELKKKLIDSPRIIVSKINLNESLLTIYHNYPINKITTTFYNFASSSSILEKNSNSICYLLKNLDQNKKFIKFEYEDENSNIIKTFDSMTIFRLNTQN